MESPENAKTGLEASPERSCMSLQGRLSQMMLFQPLSSKPSPYWVTTSIRDAVQFISEGCDTCFTLPSWQQLCTGLKSLPRILADTFERLCTLVSMALSRGSTSTTPAILLSTLASRMNAIWRQFPGLFTRHITAVSGFVTSVCGLLDCRTLWLTGYRSRLRVHRFLRCAELFVQATICRPSTPISESEAVSVIHTVNMQLSGFFGGCGGGKSFVYVLGPGTHSPLASTCDSFRTCYVGRTSCLGTKRPWLWCSCKTLEATSECSLCNFR